MTEHDSTTTTELAALDAKQADAEKEYRRQKRVLLETGVKLHTLRRDWEAVADYEKRLKEINDA